MELEFKARRADNEEYVYGYYVMFVEGVRKMHCIIAENPECYGILEPAQVKYYIDKKTLKVYTGVKNNGINEYKQVVQN